MDARVSIEGGYGVNRNSLKLSQLKKDGDVFYFPIGYNDQVIYNILNVNGYNPAEIIKDHSHCFALGYMQSPRDWKNVEMTIYVKGLSNGEGKISLSCRGGRKHAQQNGIADCEGFSYSANIYTGGTITVSKEQYSNNIYETDPLSISGSFEDIWTGIKFCVYNSNDRDVNDKSVILEIHIDASGTNNWIKHLSYVDRGGWGNHADVCHGITPDQVGIWGGPITSYKWENFDILQFKWFSVREIDPYIPHNEAGANARVLWGYGGRGSTGSGGIIRT